MPQVTLNSVEIGTGNPLTLIAGPCVIENEKMIMETAEALAGMTIDLPVQFIFKSSFQKANRTSLNGFTGLPMAEGLGILEKVKREFELPILTDIHDTISIPAVAEVADVLQIPAFLCRQTDLLLAAGRTGKIVNIKKGQFLAPEDMAKAAEKVASTGNEKVLLTERGTTFGYRNLVVDMRGLVIMSKTGYPVIFDATHSVQLPGGMGTSSGGQPEFIPALAKAALATGAPSGIFMEVHPNPPAALSDAGTQLALKEFPMVLRQLLDIYNVAQKSGDQV